MYSHTDEASALYILGDLFEAWIGDDDDAPLGREVANLLRRVVEKGCEVAFLPGNRDFLLGTEWLGRIGASLLAEPATVRCGEHALLLLHGDRECLADHDYQQFRSQVRSAPWREAFLAQSLDARRQFAEHARERSREHTRAAAGYLMDADAEALRHRLQDSGARVLVHGHTHRPALHALDTTLGPALRIVLGAWHRHPSHLRVDGKGLELHAEGLCLQAAWPA